MSGYQDCACRDCFDIAIGDGEPTLCNDCTSAGCVHYHGGDRDNEFLRSWRFECQRTDAYGVDGLEDSTCGTCGVPGTHLMTCPEREDSNV